MTAMAGVAGIVYGQNTATDTPHSTVAGWFTLVLALLSALAIGALSSEKPPGGPGGLG